MFLIFFFFFEIFLQKPSFKNKKKKKKKRAQGNMKEEKIDYLIKIRKGNVFEIVIQFKRNSPIKYWAHDTMEYQSSEIGNDKSIWDLSLIPKERMIEFICLKLKTRKFPVNTNLDDILFSTHIFVHEMLDGKEMIDSGFGYSSLMEGWNYEGNLREREKEMNKDAMECIKFILPIFFDRYSEEN